MKCVGGWGGGENSVRKQMAFSFQFLLGLPQLQKAHSSWESFYLVNKAWM